ncbi:histidine phosphatase family protein [Allobranchiibius huperziae]|uniref:Putative phosphoglycerate mutase n=1 Tax=Allobranchiibius huperziae TaxID=1874116 RepID=A0A853DGH1_9MICO|nr:histidine phosphatase family protein [Allobranchiibius huperziae]NYJ73315.1 putative phosphoglycerate mutase [Allobranchiibius huperziae]
MPTETLRVHLVRHGESTWNLAHRIQGQTVHPDLTPLGRMQAAAAAQTLMRRVDGRVVLWSSDLVRAARTAELIGRALRVPVQYDEALREQHLGMMEGRTVDQLHPEPTPPGEHVSEVRWAGGESTQDVAARFRRFAARELRATSPRVRDLVIVSHGDTIRVARAVLAARSHREVQWDPIENGSVHTVEVPRQ